MTASKKIIAIMAVIYVMIVIQVFSRRQIPVQVDQVAARAKEDPVLHKIYMSTFFIAGMK